MHVAPILLHEAGDEPRRVLGVGCRVHRRRGLGERVPAVVDLEDSVAVATVADDITPGVALWPARFLSGNRSEQTWVKVVALGGSGDLPAERHM